MVEIDNESISIEEPNCLDAEFCGQVLSLQEQNTIIERVCSTHRYSAQVQDDGTVDVVPVTESLLRPAMIRANRGLAQVFPPVSLNGGPTVTLFRNRTPLPAPLPLISKGFPPVSRQVLRFVQQQELGLIKIGPNVSRSTIIGEIALAYPAQSITVLTSTRKVAKKTVFELRDMGVIAQRIRSDRCPNNPARVVVGTYESMGHSQIELEKRDLIITHDAKEALSERAQLPLISPDIRGRLFGFVKLNEKVAPLDKDRLVATFGFHHVEVPKHGFQSVLVDTEWMKFKDKRPDGKKPSTIKRQGIWQLGMRNRLMAKRAKLALTEGRRVVVLVDTVKHACQLGKHLRGWPITIDANSHCDDLHSSDQDVLTAGKSEWFIGTNLISTSIALSGVTAQTFDTVIWAGSGPGLPPIPFKHLICSSEVSHQLTIIDFFDRHHPLLRRWSKMRREAYLAENYFERQFELDPAISRAAKFVHDRMESQR